MDPKSLACSFATLVTNDDYVSGALTLAHSLRSNGTSHEIVVLCPPNALSNRSLSLLYRAFDRIIYVPLWTNRSNKENLQLLGRPELDITYSKLHVFNPAYLEYSTVCFIDADAFALQNCDSIFDLLSPDMHFAAAPDVGWPDSFNSGVFVLRPNAQIYESLVWHATYGAGSWDGGDQGLLNRFFKSWSGFPGKETELSISADAPPQPVCPTEFTRAARLPFIYNVTPSAIYSYLPAVKEFQSDMTIIHFAGHDKPWNQSRFTDGTVWSRSLSPEIVTLHNAWWKARDGLSLKWQEEDRVSSYSFNFVN
ncbi:nucleotide-diphospho-sugar transferase [Chytriomyces sp. MP71]|nr:nucleotide-diphospho-sugar transferase [Chytriomyces sp. MP71]